MWQINQKLSIPLILCHVHQESQNLFNHHPIFYKFLLSFCTGTFGNKYIPPTELFTTHKYFPESSTLASLMIRVPDTCFTRSSRVTGCFLVVPSINLCHLQQTRICSELNSIITSINIQREIYVSINKVFSKMWIIIIINGNSFWDYGTNKLITN